MRKHPSVFPIVVQRTMSQVDIQKIASLYDTLLVAFALWSWPVEASPLTYSRHKSIVIELVASGAYPRTLMSALC